jgi:hypothetical protein
MLPSEYVAPFRANAAERGDDSVVLPLRRSRKRYSRLPAGDGGTAIAAVTARWKGIRVRDEEAAAFAAAEAHMTGSSPPSALKQRADLASVRASGAVKTPVRKAEFTPHCERRLFYPMAT